MDGLLDVRAPRPKVLTYEDWSALVWSETGAAVVAIEPPGYAKLAFDPAPFTGHSQAERRSDLAAALRGDVDTLVAVSARYGADRIVLAHRGSTVGLIGQPAVLAAAAGGTTGTTRVHRGNGWDAVVLDPGAAFTVPVASTGRVDLEIRVLAGGRFRLHAGDAVTELNAIPMEGEDFTVVTTTVDLSARLPLRLEALDPVTIQSIIGLVPDPGPPDGWTVVARTDEAIVWGRAP
jgi:hypothetical protein